MTQQNEPMSSNGTGMISGHGKFHSNKNGDKPYLRLSLENIRNLVDEPPSVPKDQAQWLIPSTCDSRVHAEQELHGEFWGLWADVDWKCLAPKPMAEVASIVDGLIGADAEIYASRSATEARQKCRVLIPLGEPLCGSEWILAQRVLNSLLLESGIEPDSASEGAGQLLYLPNRGDWYYSMSRREGVYFDPLSDWADHIADLRWKDAEEAAATRAARDAAKKRREAFSAENVGADGRSLIQAFNQAYLVEDILAQAKYAQRGNNFRHPNSETGSFSASVKNGRVFTLSSSDPLFTDAGAHDAFSAFQVLFHLGDDKAAMRDAGDNWLLIGAETWNQVQRRKYSDDRRAEQDASPGDGEPQPEARPEFEYDLNGVPHVEYGIDGFTSVGLTAIASEAGMGKTSTVVPLAATVAHLIGDPEDPFTLAPTLRRKVVYVTEDAGQVHRLLFGLRNHRSKASNAQFREWFHVVEAHRKSPEDLANDIRGWREKYSYQAGANLNHFVIEPLIVIDTSNANIDLDNENDNAVVGRAIAAIKQALEGKGMAWIVAHTAKGIRRDDIANMSLRGASAWVGDVNATVYLIQDEILAGKRFLVLGKRRFEPEFTEIEVSSEVFTYTATTPWNQRQILRYMVCDLRGLANKDRMAAQSAKARSDKYATAIIELLASEYESAMQDGVAWLGLTKNRIEKSVSGMGANVRDALAEMVKAGTINTRTEGTHKTASTFYWLPGQNRTENSSKKNRRSSDEATQKQAREGEPLGGVKSGFRASSPYRGKTKDEAPVPSGAQGAVFESSENRRSSDEADEARR